MKALRWVLLVWSALAASAVVFQAVAFSDYLTGTDGGLRRLVSLCAGLLFYALNIVFLWRARPPAS